LIIAMCPDLTHEYYEGYRTIRECIKGVHMKLIGTVGAVGTTTQAEE
jgi:hypothetical protein